MAQARRASGLTVLAAALAVAVAACSSGDDSGGAPATLKPAATGAGCGEVVRYPSEGQAHLGDGAKGSYKTHPPQSGSHAQRWASTGVHASEVSDEAQVHNLEHGAVAIQYVPGKIDAALLKDLTGFATTNSKWILLAPRAAERFDIGAVLAFTAWRVLQLCDVPTAAAADEARDFFKKYAQKAPEKVPGSPVLQTPAAA